MSEAAEPSPEYNQAQVTKKLQREQKQPTTSPHKTIPPNTQNEPIIESSEYENEICHKLNNEVESMTITTNGGKPIHILKNSTELPAKTIINKSIPYHVPNDETVKKFTTGEVIVDKKNPFKRNNDIDSGKLKKNPLPLIPTKRSTFSTLRSAHILKNKALKEDPEFITTEEVLKQSKYVKTYIKNPDKYFAFDPNVLARIKFDEWKEFSRTKPPKKVKHVQHTEERLNDLNKQFTQPVNALIIPNFKKVSKPNYPDLSDIKVKIGTDLKDSLFNPDEVAKNAKKFDERVKKLCIGSDDELDDIEETLTKSDSCDDVKLINRDGNTDKVDNVPKIDVEVKSFTNTVNSQEFQEFLKKKGLFLTHRSEGLEANTAKPNNVIPDPSPVHIVIEKKIPAEQIYSDPTPVMETQKKTKKTSVFHRLLPNGIFSSKRRTTPKEQVPIPQTLYGGGNTASKNGGTKTSTAIKRVVLERQSFHGKEGNVFSSASELKNQMERSRNSYAAGDDRRSSFSSALTFPKGFVLKDGKNTGKVKIEERSRSASEGTQTKSVSRCQASSKDRLHIPQSRDGLLKVQLQRDQIPINVIRSMPNKRIEKNSAERQQAQVQQPQKIQLRRSVTERPTVAPKRSTANASDKSQIFGRSSSMDSRETCNRSVSRINNPLPKSKKVTSTLKNGLTPKNSKENLIDGGPQSTSTPLKECQKTSAHVAKPSVSLINASTESEASTIELDQQKWGKLKEIKERTDRDLYSKVIQQAESRMAHSSQIEVEGHPHDPENIYEHLPSLQEQVRRSTSYQPQLATECKPHNFIRGLAQRNTFSGTYQNRSATNIARNTDIHNVRQVNHLIGARNEPVYQPRCQSVLDEITTAKKRERGYRSDSETPVIMRKKNHNIPRSGTLSREEILQKVKEFCRKSINKTPTKFGGSGQISHEQISSKLTNDPSSVSLVSVETHNRPPSRIVGPQVPQRIQSLPVQQLEPVAIPSHATSPIYAHVIKQNSIQSTASDQFESPQRRSCSSADYYHCQTRRMVAQSSETDSGVFGRPDTASPVRFAIIEGDKMAPARLIKYGQYGQVQMPSPYGYIRINSQQHSCPRTDGRVTPLILERGSQVGSQIYWTPTRAVEHRSLLPNYLSPCYAPQAQHHKSRPEYKAAFAIQPNPTLQDQQNVNVVYVKTKEHLSRSMNDYAGTSELRSQSTIHSEMYESESGSEAGEVQRIMDKQWPQEDWQNEKSGRNQSIEQVSDDRRRNARREDPRRHTLGGDMLQYGVSGVGVGGSGISLGSAGGGMGSHGQPQQRAMDLEMGTRAQKNKKNQPMRGYAPINQGPLFDEDPGIMSEVETASTGFRRGGKQRSSLPVVRTPSKTLERPLGLVFLQYRSETKRALLPNEITSIDTVRALFVRSFPRQLTMAYLEGPNVKIYIHDASKDMFYELEDVRSHLREIRDRSVLRLFESNEVAAPPQVLPGGPGIPQPLPQSQPTHWDQDQSYFSEPEFDSEYQHQHIHKSKGGKQAPYYVGTSQTLPRGMYSDRNKAAAGAPAKPLRSYGSRGSMGPPFPYPPDQLYSIPDGYSSSPERGQRGSYEEPYYSQYGTRGQNVAPIIDEELGEVALSDDQYALYGMKMGPGRIPRTANQVYDPTRPEDLHRIRVEHMERQLANLTGLVQKALVNQNPQIAPAVSGLNPNYLGVPSQCRGLDDIDDHSSGSSTSIQANGTGDDMYIREKAPKLGKSSCHKSVSFEKSVSFSDDIQGVQKSHSPQHAADSKPPKPAIKSSTLPRTSSQAERDRLKPPPPPKPLALATAHPTYRADIALAPEVYNHLRGLQKKAKDLRMEVRTLRRLSQAQAVAVREDIKDAFMRIRATLLASSGNYWGQGDQEKTRMSREEELYKQEVIRLEKDLSDLESSVEGLRGEVINRRTRVNMAAVEDMALVLSRASKTVAELKMRFPSLQNGLRNILSSEMEKVVREEKFLKEEPDRLESALRRCKKLTGTLVTLKRLASVQEQRLPVNETTTEDASRSADMSSTNKPIPSPRLGTVSVGGGIPPENALDALLDELQTFAKPLNQNNDFRPDDSTSDDSSQAIHSTVTTQLSQASLYTPGELQSQLATAAAAVVTGASNTLHVNSNIGSLRRLHSYPSGSDTDTSPPQPIRPMSKPPVPERNAELLSKVGNKRIPPPPPPRTSSRSPLASPTSPNVPHHLPSLNESAGDVSMGNGDNSGNSSGNESGNDHVQRQLALEVRHQELLKKQKMLQEQYARLQKMSKNSVTLPPSDIILLKKTGSESNLPQKMGLNMSVTGSMKNLNTELNVSEKNEKNLANNGGIVDLVGNGATGDGQPQHSQTTTTSKVYETDIL